MKNIMSDNEWMFTNEWIHEATIQHMNINNNDISMNTYINNNNLKYAKGLSPIILVNFWKYKCRCCRCSHKNDTYKTKFNWKYPIKSFYHLIFDNFHFKKKLSLDEVKKFSKKISNLIIGEDNYIEINPSINCKLEKIKVYR